MKRLMTTPWINSFWRWTYNSNMLTGTKAFESTTMVLADLTKFGIIADGHALWVPVHNWVMRRSNRVPNASGWKVVAWAHHIINEKFWRYNSGSAGSFWYYSGVIWACFSEVWNLISRLNYIVVAWKWGYYEMNWPRIALEYNIRLRWYWIYWLIYTFPRKYWEFGTLGKAFE